MHNNRASLEDWGRSSRRSCWSQHLRLRGINAVFADGFESGDTTVWERPTRYVVFEGFYVPT